MQVFINYLYSALGKCQLTPLSLSNNKTVWFADSHYCRPSLPHTTVGNYIHCQSGLMVNLNLASSPAPPPAPPPLPREPGGTGTHCLRMCGIFFIKSFVHLSCPYAEGYTNQEYGDFIEIDSSCNSTCRILLEYYFSGVAVSFFQNLQSNRKVTN